MVVNVVLQGEVKIEGRGVYIFIRYVTLCFGCQFRAYKHNARD